MANPITTITITNGATTSGTVYVPGGLVLVGIDVPTIDIGTLAIQVSSDNGTTFRAAKNTAGTALSFASGTGNAYWTLSPLDTYGIEVFQLVAASQSALRTFTLHFRQVA